MCENVLMVGGKGEMEKKKRLKWKMEKRREDTGVIWEFKYRRLS